MNDALFAMVEGASEFFESIHMKELEYADLNYCVRRLPEPIVNLLKGHPNQVFLAGGYIRSCITNTEVNDIDLFAPSKELAKKFMNEIADCEPIIETDNAFTLSDRFKYPVQFIHRWTYEKPKQLVESFDFTIAAAAIWADTNQFKSICHETYYADLAAKRLEYTRPQRNEDAGGSLLRVLKFYQQGFRIPLDSLGAVVARLLDGVNGKLVLNALNRMGNSSGPPSDYEREIETGKAVTELLREVDPPMNTHHLFTPRKEEDTCF